MASQGDASNSRLAQMQMRFQKKQQLEREQKKLALTAGDGSQDVRLEAKNAIGNGKVREMFERRRGVGIDRSHPLKPISSSSSSTFSTKSSPPHLPATTRRLAGGANANTTNTRRTVISTKQTTTTTTSTMRNSNSHPNALSSNGNIFDSDFDQVDNLESETFPKEFTSLSLNSTRIMGDAVHDGNNNLNRSTNGLGKRDIMDTTITLGRSTNGIKLNPVITKKSPNTTSVRTTAASQRSPLSSANRTTAANARTAFNGTATTTTKTKTPPVRKSPTTTGTITGAKGATKTTSKQPAKPATFVLSVKPPPRIVTPPPGMATCQFCQRNFNEERLEKHQEVCRKMMAKKRKIFDASKHRVQGTEAETYVKKNMSRTSMSTAKSTASVVSNNQQASGKQSNWRKKHEEFINAIREAKKVQAHLAKGGKLSDLPPPPPSENPDYIQCPHCSRRFNESAAERHIPKCANMKHNKPKPPVQKKRF